MPAISSTLLSRQHYTETALVSLRRSSLVQDPWINSSSTNNTASSASYKTSLMLFVPHISVVKPLNVASSRYLMTMSCGSILRSTLYRLEEYASTQHTLYYSVAKSSKELYKLINVNSATTTHTTPLKLTRLLPKHLTIASPRMTRIRSMGLLTSSKSHTSLQSVLKATAAN